MKSYWFEAKFNKLAQQFYHLMKIKDLSIIPLVMPYKYLSNNDDTLYDSNRIRCLVRCLHALVSIIDNVIAQPD
jgi:hypothetical protein